MPMYFQDSDLGGTAMLVVGTFVVIVMFLTGLLIAQVLFFQKTGRFFWRAIVPTYFRYLLFPNDKVELDSFMIVEEWSALILFGSFFMLPLIALNVMGIIFFF